MSDFVDPYIDQESGILKNKLGIKNADDLREAEGNMISFYDAAMDEIPRTRDLIELRAIHKRLFDKIYDWAGELRIVEIGKSDEYFLDYTYIGNGARFVFNELSSENYLQGLNRDDFVKRLAYFYEQLNFIHPFREGNGRTQRIFWQRIANDAGYIINWPKIVGDALNQASMIGRTKRNLKPLEELFDKIVVSGYDQS